MNTKILALTVLASLLASSTAQFVSRGSCPDNVQVVDSFDVSKYLGKWFEYAKYQQSFEAGGKCITAQYTLNDNGNVDVLNTLVNEWTNKVSDITGTASLVSPGKLLVKFPVSPPMDVSSNYWVLDTDYDNYSVVYSCIPLNKAFKATSVWILTREQLPEPSFIEKAVSVLKENDVSLTQLKITNQVSCNN